MFYQSQHSIGADAFTIENGKNLNFPAHLHGSFELICVTSGNMEVTVDRRKYRLDEGSALLVFPNQLHMLTTPKESSHFLFIFSPKLVQAYNKIFLSKVPERSAFVPSEHLLRALKDARETDSLLKIKGLLYTLCAEFDETATYTERTLDRDALLLDVFKFVETHYQKDCTLEALSAATSYHYVYLSKYFKERTGEPFIEYVNRYRINEACYTLTNTDLPVLRISLDCGFDSLRSFNRNFKKFVGMTPSEYRKAPKA